MGRSWRVVPGGDDDAIDTQGRSLRQPDDCTASVAVVDGENFVSDMRKHGPARRLRLRRQQDVLQVIAVQVTRNKASALDGGIAALRKPKEVVLVFGECAHAPGRNVQQEARRPRAVRHAARQSSALVDEVDVQATLAAPEQVRDEDGSAEACPNDRYAARPSHAIEGAGSGARNACASRLPKTRISNRGRPGLVLGEWIALTARPRALCTPTSRACR